VKVVHGSGGSGVDERRRGETGTGRRSALLKHNLVVQVKREKGGWVSVGSFAWRREKEERGGPSAVVGSAGRPVG
jgi:hypothetical protein